MSDVNIGTLAGRIEIEDHISSTFDILAGKIDRLDEKFGTLHGGVTHAAEGFFLGELAIKAFEKGLDIVTDLVKDFTVEGAGIADVEENFKRLSIGAGLLGETLLGTLRQGTHNTITDFELMKSVNDNLTAGVKLTDDQYKVLAEGGFALAQSKGLSVKQVFDSINESLLTGNVRNIRYLVGKVDLANAEVDYALKLGKTRDQLSETEKAEADRLGILEAVTVATGRLGEQVDGLDEMYAQASTFVKNFYEDLIKGAASSPHVLAAFESIRDSVVEAFGGDSQNLLQTFLGWINDTADAVTTYAPIVVHGLVEIKDWFVEFYHSVVDAWHTYGPVVVGGFTMMRDWIVTVYHTVIDTWQALPDWLKTVAEKSALTAAGLYLVMGATNSASDGIGHLIGMAGNLTTTFAGMPAALGHITEGLMSVKLLAGLTTLEFTSMAAARTSISLLAGSVTSMLGPLGIATVYAGLLYGAFELGKWQPISDFFQNLGLKIMGYGEAERAAMIATDHLTQAAAAQAKGQSEAARVQEEAKAIMDALAKAQAEAAAAAALHANAEKDLNVQLSAADREKFIASWGVLSTLTNDYKQTLLELNPAVRQSVQYYADLGASAEDLIAAFPRLTKAQADAAVTGAAAGKELRQVYLDTFGIINKAHGDNINLWIKGEKEKFDITMEALKQEGKLTDERLAAETEKFNAMIDGEVKKRAEQVDGSRAKYQAEYDEAKNKLDLMLRDYADFSDEEIRIQEHLTNEKLRALNTWRSADHQALQAQKEEFKSVYEEMDAQLRKLYGDAQKLTITPGGSFDVTSQNFEATLRGLITGGGWNPTGMGSNIDINQAYSWAKQGYSMQEITTMFQNMKNGANGPIPPPKGPRIPGFNEGGVGDFGSGTLAMLHGKEAIVPLDRAGGFGAQVVNFYVNGTAVQVAQQIKDIILRDLQTRRQF